MSLRLSALCWAILAICIATVAVHAYQPTVPRTEKKYLIHVHPLSEGFDDAGEEPTLVSVTETTSLWLPRGSADDNDEHLNFNEDMDPFWVHVLRRRRFDSLEWSGCGGSWRSEWSAALYDTSSPISESTTELIYDLSHHTVCYFSGLSACGWGKTETLDSDDENSNRSADPNAEARRHHQWLAQFVSSLLSSPLSWSKETPRHIRPVGALHSVSGDGSVAAGKGNYHWCSYHLAQHDTVCTQHVSALLNGGRSGKGIEERIPDGIFRAGLLTMEEFFSSGFHHFHFGASQSPVVAQDAAEETEIKLLVRMAFVARKGVFGKLAAHWKEYFPSYAGRLTFVVGPRTNAQLRDALQFTMGTPQVEAAPRSEENLTSLHSAWTGELAPTAQYYITTVGHDRGNYRLVVFPPTTTAHQASDALYGLRPGDTLESLLMFPLHVLRPSLHAMQSNPPGSSTLENAFFDDSANVLVVLVKTVLTEAHIREARMNEEGSMTSGFVVCEFPFKFGWAALKDMPHDANSNRILPQPVIRLGKSLEDITEAAGAATTVTASVGTERCAAPKCAALSMMRIDHQESLERFLESLLRNKPRNESTMSCMCYFWLRCNNVAGTTIPVPDPAMVFNVISLGLIFSGVLSGGVTRITRRFFEKPKDEEVDKADKTSS
ncbi:glycosylphosphatidylinositol (GPI) anchor [Trypanosoma grayi]|uniref:glycosylphosphatidylinositol (GPI) anchor n=1 Tax=Trypanosoma grayi TaxID=71804 RepID=UPI0004F49679|nr:glycosylphosphatidylinositol (GPI) anchor [Trypanosoma grayi]KEG11819.1 glycosylphosphatidylinositol (GPI) anchor [Trypanosoma grayi]